MSKFSVFGVLLFSLSLFSFSNPNERHIGEWRGTDSKGNKGVLILGENQKFLFKMNNDSLKSDHVEPDGRKVMLRYDIDYTRVPIWLDFVFYDKATNKEERRLKGIVQFVTDNKMMLRVNFSGKRDSVFDPEDSDHTIMLEKYCKSKDPMGNQSGIR